ncbi:hypothetical protein NBRC116592_03620 [Colwellia sp. KU-HH00111]|uniref:formylglycine-generating enzyme family protein n=1 Tax=Colwellia sp. KU-HH00111 TaxID=3127652 RepID=UPI0031028045
MKKIIILLLLPIMMVSLSSHGQSSINNQAKAYYMAAEEAFNNKQYDDALKAVDKVESLLGKSNALLSALKVKTYFEQEKFIEAKAEIDVFFGFNAKVELAREVSSYLIKIDKGIEEQKRSEQVAKDKAERERLERVVREKAEKKRLAKEKAERKATEIAAKTALNKSQEQIIALERYSNITGELVAIPSGEFSMGCVSGKRCESNEKPVHIVEINSFVMMATEVTFLQWDACVSDGRCYERPDDDKWGRGNRPVINVSSTDITRQFIPWLNNRTGRRFSLPSEAQWEYAARAGSKTRYNWGGKVNCSKARFGHHAGVCGKGYSTLPVKSFTSNGFGLYDMHGNVAEWTRDCRNDTYNGAPSSGKAWFDGDCEEIVVRGGYWGSSANSIRSASRYFLHEEKGWNRIGFRLVIDVE